MLDSNPTKKMNNRGGLPVKNIVTAIFILLSVYLLYIYNATQNRLHDAEMTGSRYRREAEEKANEIQGLIAAKDDFQKLCETEKRELDNRLKSVNQKHSMLQSQNTEIEADFMKLKQDMENLRAEHTQKESQHEQEYQTLKQTKEKEITDLTEELESVKRQNGDLHNTVVSLQAQVQTHEMELQNALQMIETLQTAKKSLLEKNAQLQMLQFQQQQQFELQKKNEENAEKAKLLQQQQQQMNVNVISEKQQGQQDQQNINNDIFKMSQSKNDNPQVVNPADENKGNDQQAEKIDELNAMNQAKAPNLNGEQALDEDQRSEDEKDDDENRPAVNPNDLQKAQILEPLKQDGGEVDAEGKMNVRDIEERREREEMDNQAAEHKNPLDLGQMQQPLGLGDGGQDDLEGNDKLGQQQPPVFVGQNHGDINDDAGLEDDQRHYYQNRAEEEDIEENEEDDDDVNNELDDDEEDALDVNNNDRDKAVDDQLNAWQNFNMGPQPPYEDNKDHIGNLNNNDDDMDGDTYDDKDEDENKKDEEAEEDDDVEEEEEEDNADDDYGANIDGAAADGPLNGAAV